jgi:hypothetical protein
MLLFARVNLLREMHLVLHLLPALSMVGTLWAVSRLEVVDSLPSVLRLQGFMMLVGLGCAGLLAVHKTFIGSHGFKKQQCLMTMPGRLPQPCDGLRYHIYRLVHTSHQRIR